MASGLPGLAVLSALMAGASAELAAVLRAPDQAGLEPLLQAL